MQKVVRPTRSPWQQWPPRRTKNEKYVYSTSKSLKASPEKSQTLSCDTVVLWHCCVVTVLSCDTVVLWHCCVVTLLCCRNERYHIALNSIFIVSSQLYLFNFLTIISAASIISSKFATRQRRPTLHDSFHLITFHSLINAEQLRRF